MLVQALLAGLAAAAAELGLPLIVFEREVPFIAITEAVHARIIDDHLEQLRASARLHEVFTDLAVAGAGPARSILILVTAFLSATMVMAVRVVLAAAAAVQAHPFLLHRA